MNIDSIYLSKHIKAADLQGRQIEVEIDRVEMEDVGDDHKPVVYFVGKEKGLVLNKTNAATISELHGVETDAWIGQRIVLFSTKVDYSGRRVDAIRIMPPRAAPRPAAPRPAPAAANHAAPVDDEIPF